MATAYKTTIGLEVHVQLATDTKLFCGCKAQFGQAPNSQVCPVCLGLPGTLPVLNERAFELAIKTALALNCSIEKLIKFERKNYFYPDLPKAYQISQFSLPLSSNGVLEIETEGGPRKIGITRAHLEEDAGKLIHKQDCSLVDYNRGGTTLLEIVSEPELHSPQEAYDYLIALKALLEYLEVSDCNMEEGSLRCDANISAAKSDSVKLGVKVELKNMNSFKGVRSALSFEEIRITELLKKGETIAQETRLWDAEQNKTLLMRAKEESHDYRYFPEPDLVPFAVEKEIVKRIKDSLPELPAQRKKRFMTDYKLSEYDSSVLTSNKKMADYLEECLKSHNNPKALANWIMGDISSELNKRKIDIPALALKPAGLASLLKMIDRGEISGKIAKDVLAQAIETGSPPGKIVKSKGLAQIKDTDTLEKIIKEVISKNEKSVSDYKSGKSNAAMFLVGQVMRQTKGKANPQLVNKLLKKYLA